MSPAARVSAAGFHIRPYRAGDRSRLYRICLETGAAGRDASALYRERELLGHLYVGPYAELEPERAFVLVDAGGAVQGYAVGALDTGSFHRRVRERWLPALARRYPAPRADRARWSPDERLRHLLHRPDEAFPLETPEALEPYPSHLHIDLLPRAQGRGLGRALMGRLLARLAADGSHGVHLGVDPSNVRAIGFYAHLGFVQVALAGEGEQGGAVWMAMHLP